MTKVLVKRIIFVVYKKKEIMKTLIQPGDTVYYEGNKYTAGKHESDSNLRYLHDITTGYHSEDCKADVLKVNETRVTK